MSAYTRGCSTTAIAAVGSTAAALAILWLGRRRRVKDPEVAALPPKVTSCTLTWASELQPCFCRPSIRMNLSVLTPNADTVAAIFGSPDPTALMLCDVQTGDSVEATDLVCGGSYTVEIVVYKGSSRVAWVPIKQLASTVDEATVQRLSNAFYQRVWAEPENSPFRTFFVNHVESPTVAADAQWRWLVEIWGGAKRYTERFGDDTLINKMLSKHSAARMSYQNCRRWLQLMLAAMDEVGLGGEVSIRRYWLHFFGFFELTLAQRRELRALALPGTMAESEL